MTSSPGGGSPIVTWSAMSAEALAALDPDGELRQEAPHQPGRVPAGGGWAESLRPGGVLGLSTSLGSGEGWDDGWPPEPDPGRGERRDPGLRRWFVHHRRGPILRALAEAGFHATMVETSVSHRTWLKVIACTAAEPS